jgi:hypothetical protein
LSKCLVYIFTPSFSKICFVMAILESITMLLYFVVLYIVSKHAMYSYSVMKVILRKICNWGHKEYTAKQFLEQLTNL